MSLTKKVYLTISGYDIKLSDNLTFYQKDQLKLIFYINEYGIDYENNATTRALMPVNPLNAILFIENPDGVDSVSSAKIEDNAVTFYLDSTHTQYVGISRMQLRLFDQDGCAITLPHFTFEIRENIYGSGDVRFQNVVMVDQTGTVILTEDNDLLDVGDILTMGTEVAYPQVTKTIKELPIKHGLDGTEKLIVEDNEATKQAPLGTIVDEIKQNSQEKIREIESELAQTNAQLSNVYNDINNRISQNKQFSFTFGTSTWFGEHSDGGKAKLEKMLMYFDTTIQCLKIQYDDVKGSFVSPSSENIAEQVQAYNDYINNGGKTFGIKFHQTGEKMKDLFDKHGSKKICEEYSKYVINFINTLPYKSHIKNVWIMNEAGVQAFATAYEADVINAINSVKAEGYKVSTPYANAYAITDSSQEIVMANDFISLNCYPLTDYFGKRSNIRDVAERFDKEFAIVERYLNKKDLYITEFGCSSSWKSFSYPPSYYQDGESRPIALFIEGFFQSRFMGNIKGAWYWYHYDAMTYASDTLLSVKYNTEVRYG